MTAHTDAPARPKRFFTPFRIIELLIVIGAVLWALGVFKKTPKVAIITSGEGPYWDLVEAGAKRAAEVYDVKVSMIRVKTDMQAQVDAIRAALDGGYDGIAISPINPVGQAGALAEVAGKTTLVTLDSDSPVARRLCYVGTDNYEAGRLAGQLVRNAIPDGGEVIISVGNVEKQNTQRRRQGVIDELLDRAIEPEHPMDPIELPLKGEKYTIVATLVDGGDPAIATDLAAKALKEHPNAKCIVGLLSYSASSLVNSLEEAGKAGQVKVVGFDAADATLAAIEQGKVFGTIMQDQFGCGYHAVRILGQAARGDRSELPVFDKRILPCESVTKENLEAIRMKLSGNPATQPS